jgi:predicted acyl esterase
MEKLRSGDIVPLEIEIWPSATIFEAGSILQLTIQGHDAARYPGFGHRDLVNRGRHTIFTGGSYDSCLTVPLNRYGLKSSMELELSPARA